MAKIQFRDVLYAPMTRQQSEELRHKILTRPTRSAWDNGVLVYAVELVSYLDGLTDQEFKEAFENRTALKTALLNGAKNWHEYSSGGCSLIYGEDIAERLCTPTELKRTKNGRNAPNRYETWIDVQTRALRQAACAVINGADNCGLIA